MKVVDIAVKRPVTIWMFTLAVLLFGMVSLSRLTVNLLPELTYPTLTIRTDYEGAAPGELEQLVSKPIEEAVGVVKGIRHIQSVSKPSQSDVILEFEWGTEMDLASLEVREKLDVLQLPLDVKKPLLLKFNPSLDPIMRYGIQFKEEAGGNFKLLRTFAEEEIKRKLESVQGVASVKLGGGLEQEIQVLVDQRKAAQLGISIKEISARLANENLNQSGGKVEDVNQEYLVRTINQFKTLEDINNVFIAKRGSKNIRLQDIATVKDRYKERSSITRINGVEAIEIALYKEGDANTVDVASLVKSRISKLESEIPEKYSLIQVYDQSTFIANAISEVKSNAIIGGILAMFVLCFFLKNLWATFIISISIPVSVIATFNLMYGNDISLNIMSLGGIALAVGLLVDNSIVVLENIARKKEQEGDTFESAAKGTKEVSTAILASTLTTMAVFFPLVFVEGIAGQLFSDQALTVTFALLASLIVALTLIPMLSAQNARKRESKVDSYIEPSQAAQKPTGKFKLALWYIALPFKLVFKLIFVLIPMALTILITGTIKVLKLVLSKLFSPLLWVFDLAYGKFESLYKVMLNTALSFKYVTIGLVVTISASIFTLLPKLGMELIPSMSQGELILEVTLPPGTQLENTDFVLKELSSHTAKHEKVAKTFALAGTGSLMNASPSQGGDYWGRLNIVLNNGSTQQDEEQVIAHVREKLNKIAGVEAKFSRPELFSFSTPLEAEVTGYNLNTLQSYSDELVGLLASNDRFVDIKSTLRSGQPEIKIYFNHSKIAQLGLSVSEVANVVASKVGGEVATKFNVNDRKIDILVRASEDERNSVADIKNLIINPQSNLAIPLSAVAEIKISTGPSEITRIGQERVAIISSNLAYGELSEAVTVLNSIIETTSTPFGVRVEISGQSEEMDVSFRSLQFALLLAVFMVYIVMASQFESLLHPLLILFTVPLAAAGSILGLAVTGTTISVIVFIGLIMLAGIVVNNAIVLIDKINQLREQGANKMDAITEGAQSRLRPILMTTLTTVLGLLPLAIGTGEGAEIRAPMAITVISGLLFATLLTLIFIPSIYSVFDRKSFKHNSEGNDNG